MKIPSLKSATKVLATTFLFSTATTHAAALINYDLTNNGGERGWRGNTGSGVSNFLSWTVTNNDLQTGTSTFNSTPGSQFAVGANSGSSPAMFGGLHSTYSGTGAGLDATSDLFGKVSVLSFTGTGQNNAFLTRVAGSNMVGGSTMLNRGAFLVAQSDFLNLQSGLIGLSGASFSFGMPSTTNTDYVARMVILGNDSKYYVSSTNMSGSGLTVGNANSFSIADLSAESWFDIGTSGESLISTSFATYGSAGAISATSFTAAGFIYEQTVSQANGNRQLYLGGMTLTGDLAAVPEPSTFALLGAGLGALCLLRRRRNRL